MSTADFKMVMAAIGHASGDLAEFTSDDIWDRLPATPMERNVVGKAVSEANRLGLISGTERFVKSRRPESKGRRIQVWTAARREQEALF